MKQFFGQGCRICAPILWALATPALGLPEKMGDFDNDDTASILDVVRLINHVTQADPLPGDLAPYADVNLDGYVDQDDVQGLVDRVLERLPLDALPLTFLRNASPAPGEGSVAVTRETILRFSIQLSENHGLNANSLYAEFGGKRLATRINVSPNRKTVTLFYDKPLPANSRIRVTMKGDEILDYQGRKIDGDGDGEEGGDLIFDFDTLGLTVLEGTIVCGRVFASELTTAVAAQADVNQPLEGAKITVDGMEDEVFAITDEFGNFRLDPAPAGRFFVHIDGRTATINVPEGAYYPFVGKAWQSKPGEEVNVGNIYLPLVKKGTLKSVSNTEDVTISLPDTVVNEFPDFADVAITVPAGSLFNDNGTRGGQVGIAPVDPNRLPGTLPPQLNFPLVITVQTDGATNFDTPAPICFPNLPDPDTGALLGPGEKSALWSFNHDTGRFEIVGSMTVSNDGKMVCTDPGVGILAPGWHATQAGAVASGGTITSTIPGAGDDPSDRDRAPPNTPEAQLTPGCPLWWDLCGKLASISAFADSVSNAMHSAKKEIENFIESIPGAIHFDGFTHPVYYFSGEFFHASLDMQIKGRGMDFIWHRRYRSKIGPNTEQGNGWDHAYNVRLELDGEDVLLFDGNGRSDQYFPAGPNQWSRDGFFRDLRKNEDGSYTLEFENKGSWDFHPFELENGPGKLAFMADRNGNKIHFFYDSQDRLERINDTLDRDITIAYNTDGFISTVTDFIGRTVTYDYYDGIEPGGNFGDLKSCTGPAVTGTPNGNDFPNGKTTSYTYTTGFSDERLNHNLLSITDGRRNDPNDPTFGDGPYLINVYSATQNPEDFNYDRVVRQIWGGDTIDLVYEPLAPAGETAPAKKTILNDRNGNVNEYYFDTQNRLVELREYTGRANPTSPTNSLTNRPIHKLRTTDPDFFETKYTYNQDSLVTEIVHPNGNITQNVYEGDVNPNANPRFRGNLRISRRLPGSHLPTGDQNVIEEQYEYDTSFGCGSCGFNFVTRHVDGRGNETRMIYDDRGNMVQRIHRIESVIEDFEYNEFGQLIARVLPDNGSNHRRRDEFTYYDSGPQNGYLKGQIVDAAAFALTTTLTYDAVGNMISVTDPKGNDTQLIYNQLNQVVRTLSREVVDGSGIRYERDFYYDANNNLIQLDVQNRDAIGSLGSNSHFSTVWNYEILNNPVRFSQEVDESKTIVQEYEYDENRNLTFFRKGESTNGNQPANSISKTYDERDLLFRKVSAAGDAARSTDQYDYDPNGNLVTTRTGIENQPRIFTRIYDGYNRPVALNDPMGNSLAFTFDANGNRIGQRAEGERVDSPSTVANQRLSETIFTYDLLDRLTQKNQEFFETETGQTIADGKATQTIEYSGTSQILAVTDDNNHSTNFQYDSANRLLKTTDAVGNTATVTYDANSNVLSILSVEKNDLGTPDEAFTSSLEYDNLDRRMAAIDNRGNRFSSAYDSRNNLTTSIDSIGNEIRHRFDGLNRLMSTTRILRDNGLGSGNETAQIVTQKVWDDSNRLIQQIDPNGNVTANAFDPLDRTLRKTYADSTQFSLSYDVHDNVISYTDGNGNSVTADYDLLNRLIGRSISPSPGVSPDTTFESFDYDGLSRLVRAEDDDSVVTREYDSLSQQTSETLNGQTTLSQYDGVGNLIRCVYPGGRTIEALFDDLNRKSEVTDFTNPNSPSEIVRFDFVGPSRIARRDYGNGTRTDLSYNGITGIPDLVGDFGVRKIIKTRHSLVSSGEILAEHSYTWDRMGNKTSRQNLTEGIDQAFNYDSAYRLIQSLKNGVSTEYSLDLTHNRTQVTGEQNPGNYVLDSTLPEPADAQVNQYTSTPQGDRLHDANGNLLTDSPGRMFTYDYANRMVAFTDGITNATYQYDAFGRRIAKTVDGNSTLLFYAPGYRVCEEQNDDNITIATYVHGVFVDDMVQMQHEGEDFYYHTDDLYSTKAVTNSTGGLVESIEYGDYGKPLAESVVKNPYLYTGRRYDPETGFYYYRTRYLDPLAGRFTTRDTIGIWGDRAAFGNGLSYVSNNPESSIDPYGLSENTWVPKNTTGKGTVFARGLGVFGALGVETGVEIVKLDNGICQYFLYVGGGLGAGASITIQGGRVENVYYPSDYEGPFGTISVSAGPFGGSEAWTPGNPKGAKSVCGGVSPLSSGEFVLGNLFGKLLGSIKLQASVSRRFYRTYGDPWYCGSGELPPENERLRKWETGEIMP